jgi:hypothetical protein
MTVESSPKAVNSLANSPMHFRHHSATALPAATRTAAGFGIVTATLLDAATGPQSAFPPWENAPERPGPSNEYVENWPVRSGIGNPNQGSDILVGKGRYALLTLAKRVYTGRIGEGP